MGFQFLLPLTLGQSALGSQELLALAGDCTQEMEIKPHIQLKCSGCMKIKWEMGGGMEPAASGKKGLLDTVEETQDTDRQMLEHSFAQVELI